MSENQQSSFSRMKSWTLPIMYIIYIASLQNIPFRQCKETAVRSRIEKMLECNHDNLNPIKEHYYNSRIGIMRTMYRLSNYGTTNHSVIFQKMDPINRFVVIERIRLFILQIIMRQFGKKCNDILSAGGKAIDDKMEVTSSNGEEEKLPSEIPSDLKLKAHQVTQTESIPSSIGGVDTEKMEKMSLDENCDQSSDSLQQSAGEI